MQLLASSFFHKFFAAFTFCQQKIEVGLGLHVVLFRGFSVLSRLEANDEVTLGAVCSINNSAGFE